MDTKKYEMPDNYILVKGMKKLCHCGEVNLPFGTPAFVQDKFICVRDGDTVKPLCLEHSETAFRYFAWNGDEKGEERKDLINSCIDEMSRIYNKDEQFATLIFDPVCMRYKRNTLDDSEWIWDRDKVHKAPIGDLKYMLMIFKSMAAKCVILGLNRY